MMDSFIISGWLALLAAVVVVLAKKQTWSREAKEELVSIKELNESLISKSTNLYAELSAERQKSADLIRELLNTKTALEKEVQKNSQIVHQKKSSETRLGQISEQLAPFLDSFKYDPKTAHFLGSPLDYVIFDTNSDDPSVVFLEIKTGGSKLSASQKTIKNLIKSGKVRFEELRIEPKGQKSKVTRSEDEEQ